MLGSLVTLFVGGAPYTAVAFVTNCKYAVVPGSAQSSLDLVSATVKSLHHQRSAQPPRPDREKTDRLKLPTLPPTLNLRYTNPKLSSQPIPNLPQTNPKPILPPTLYFHNAACNESTLNRRKPTLPLEARVLQRALCHHLSCCHSFW